ncbi:MAG: UTP--glucose-1-phosphate uridylyltransferase [Pseudomonadota bacterium]
MLNHSDTSNYLPAFISKMEAAGIHPVVIDTFTHYYKQILAGETGLISGREIEPVAADEVEDASRIKRYAAAGKQALNQTVTIKLNGGLGTSMGLTGAKSLLEVKNGATFLEMMLMQAARSEVKLALMNSYSTHDDTMAALAKMKPSEVPLVFLQNKFPKILRKDLSPAAWPQNPTLEWNPPGHGDIYSAIYTSGRLKHLLDKGIAYAFISNSDNLGATMDTALLGYFSEHNFPFMMEVARRTPADVKGGHIARHKDGRLILREAAQCPQDEIDAFQDIHLYGFFNTNNIWINLKVLENLIEKHGVVKLPMIRNPKTLDPRDENSPEVYQVEAAMGAAISLFEGATVIQIPDFRFFPVKKCNDLLAIRSDRFVFSKEKTLSINPAVRYERIEIDLDPTYYGKVDLFNQRFSEQVPSLIECESLKIRGDVRFESGVKIKGRVVIKNSSSKQALVKEGTVIDDNLIFG